MHSRGFYVSWNAGGFIADFTDSNTVKSTKDWWLQIIGYADGLCAEMQHWHKSIPGDKLRRAGSAWYQNWESWQELPALTEANGIEFLTIHYSPSAAHDDYQVCSMLLETKRGTSCWKVNGVDNGMADPWHPLYDKLKTLGNPVGVKTKNGNRWQRQYEGGIPWVDPVVGIAGIL
jgi:hypothetical protein